MKSASLREFVRNYQSLYPIPKDGIEIVRRNESSLFLYPSQMYASTNEVENLAELIASKVAEKLK